VSLSALVWASTARAPSPLCKLILIRFADQSAGSGEIDVESMADFCATTPAEVRAAIDALVGAGLLYRMSPTWVALAGFEGDPRPIGPRQPKKKRISTAVRAAVFARDGLACQACAATDDLTLDHIVPESKGGSHDPGNLRTLCRRCNSSKGVKHEVAS